MDQVKIFILTLVSMKRFIIVLGGGRGYGCSFTCERNMMSKLCIFKMINDIIINNGLI